MNCSNCGAPLELVEGRHYFFCQYCGTFCFPQDASSDGVVVLGGDADLACPVCGTALTEAAIEGARVLHCPTCRGILARQTAFYNIVRMRRAQAQGPPERPRPINPQDLQRDLYCPSCGRLMDTHPYYGPGNLVIDTCGHCALIWLDYGEMRTITDAPGDDRGVGWRAPAPGQPQPEGEDDADD